MGGRGAGARRVAKNRSCVFRTPQDGRVRCWVVVGEEMDPKGGKGGWLFVSHLSDSAIPRPTGV